MNRQISLFIRTIFVAISILFLLSGCSVKGHGPITEQMIIDRLHTLGLELTPIKVKEDWVLIGVEPNRFTITKQGETSERPEQIAIYIFESEEKVEEGLKDFEKQTAFYDMIVPRKYQIKNALIFYWSRESMVKRAKYELELERVRDELILYGENEE